MKNKHNLCNSKDHEKWNRRSFIQALGLAGAGTVGLAGSSLTFAKNSQLTAALNDADSDRILVLVRLFGGNDGLNTIVPLNQYDEYANARPNLRHQTSELWNLSDDYAMPNFTNSLENMWDDGKMKIVHSVGYDDFNQSHFKGSDIWSAAKPDLFDVADNTGWLGRYFEDKYPDYINTPPEVPTAVEIGASKNITFNGIESRYSFSVANLNRLETIAESGLAYSLDGMPDCTHGDKLTFMRAMANSTYGYSGIINDAYNSSSDYTGGNGYINDKFAESVNIIARLIKGNLGSKIYMLTLGGFDHHSNQEGAHEALLTLLTATIDQFYKDLSDAGLSDKVLTMTVSEFGRRVAENGSRGTDHGTACPLMFFGDCLDGSGFVGQHASLKQSDLVNNRDLQYHTDFRSVYATVLKEWLCVDPNIVDNTVLGNSYDTVDLGFSCQSNQTLSNPTLDNSSSFRAYAFYQEGSSLLVIESSVSQHIVIKLHDLNGKYIGEISNKLFTAGKEQIDIKNALRTNLSRGYYIYTVSSNSNTSSRKIMIL